MSFFKSALSSVGSVLNDITGVSSSYEDQRKAMREQNAYNTQMWNLQNEYNTPASQLARMREAGIDINPTSYALGTGNLSNTAALVGSASGFQGSPAGNPISALMGVASGIQGIKESKARTDNMEKQNENLTGVIKSTRLENEIRSHNLQYAQEHNLPVSSVPNMDATIASVVNKGMKEFGDVAGDIYNIWQKHRNKYKESHPDYNGW